MNDSESRCFTQHALLQGPPLIQNGELKLQAHDVGWIIAGFLTIIATVVSFWLVSKHLMWYTNKRQQRYIVRLLLMVPIYATISLASYIWWNHAIPITLVRDSYESFVLYSFFYLLLQYLSPTIEGQKEVFRHVVLQKWMFPLGFVKYRPSDGLYFLQLMKWGVLQYSIIRPTTTMAAIFLDFVGLYCEDSWSPGWGHVYITIIMSISVTIAMYCLVQLYLPISSQLKPHKPLLKLFSIKAVVFLTFWQATFLSVLSMFDVVKDTPYMTAEDINTGIAAILETFEMVCFAFLHIRAFSYRPYSENHTLKDRTPRLRSLAHALDVREMFREIRDGSVYMGKKMRGIEPEKEARMRIHFAQAMGRERQLTEMKPLPKEPQNELGEATSGLLDERRDRYERTKLWISDSGDRFGGDFEAGVLRELRNRDLGTWMEEDEDYHYGHSRGKKSWWRGIYDRISQSGPEKDEEETMSQHHSSRKPRGDQGGHSRIPSLESPPPPPSIIFEYSPIPDVGATVRPSPLRQKPKRSSLPSSPPQYNDKPKKSKHSPGFRPPKTQDKGESPIAAPRNNIIIPQPILLRQHHEAESLASQPRNIAHDSARKDPSLLNVGLSSTRSDYLFGRVFADPTVSEEDRTVTTPSHETQFTELMYPTSMALPSLPENQTLTNLPVAAVRTPSGSTPPSKRTSLPLSQSGIYYPRRVPQPKIVLPAPLSPARYPYRSETLVQHEVGAAEQNILDVPPPRWDAFHQQQFPNNSLSRQNKASLPSMPRVITASVPVVQVVPDIRSTNLPSTIVSPSDRYPVITSPMASSPLQSRHKDGDMRRVPSSHS